MIPPQIILDLDATHLYTGIRREASSKAITLLDICAGVLEPASAEAKLRRVDIMQARPERCADCAAVRPIWGTIFGVVLNCAAPCIAQSRSTHRTMASRPFGVRGAFLWLLIWSFRGTLKLRNFSFLGADQIDNLLKDHI